MIIENYIQELLFEHSCVVIPDFGGFIAEHRSAEIHPITNKFTPPMKRIAFNELLKVNDGLLANTIAREETITMQEAMETIKKFVLFVKEELRINKSYIFPEIGKIYYNEENKLEFVSDTRINYSEDSFGFQDLFFKPIERNKNEMSSTQRPVRPVVRRPISTDAKLKSTEAENAKPEKKNSALKMVLIIVPLLLLVIGGGIVVFNKNSNTNLASLNIFGNSKEDVKTISENSSAADNVVSEETPVEEVSEDITESSENEEISTEIGGSTVFRKDDNPAKQNLIDKQKELSENEQTNEGIGSSTAQHGRYFVVVGSFISRENAYKLRNKVANVGTNVTVIEPSPSSKFYKVAVDDFDNKEDALRKKNELANDFGGSVWVMSY